MIPLDHVIALSAVLFMIGVIGVATRRNLIIVLMSIELMLNAVNLALVAFSRMHGNADGHVVFRRGKSIDVDLAVLAHGHRYGEQRVLQVAKIVFVGVPTAVVNRNASRSRFD